VTTTQPTLAYRLAQKGLVSGPQHRRAEDSARSRPGVEHDPTVTDQQIAGGVIHLLTVTEALRAEHDMERTTQETGESVFTLSRETPIFVRKDFRGVFREQGV
jgi:hypothetical protein